MDEMLRDARFAHIARDPKFARIPKAERKVKIDKRFQGMFKDKKFAIKYTSDKRGRPIHQTNKEDLKKFYDISSSEDDESDKVVSVSVSKESVHNKNIADTRPKEKDTRKKNNTLEQSSYLKDSSDTDSEDNECNINSSNGNLLKLKQDFHTVDHELDNVSLDNVADQIARQKHSELDLCENDIELQINEQDKNSKLTTKIKEKLKNLNVNYARGEGILLTDSSSEEESLEDSDEEEEEIEHKWGELDKEAETTDEITNRLAICNMDWDRIRAVDLMILLNSFLPNGGLLRSIIIYPSEYGRQRMKEEEMAGPIELKNEDIHNLDENTEDNEEGTMYHMEKLRQYQLNRLKYYYAVAEFDSSETANKIYTECDGIEYESTATRLDLRFIPDDMVFDEEPKEICNKIPEPTKYQPRQFTTTALQQIKVELTWDETNLDRQEFTQKLNSGKLQDIDKNDLQTYLASASEDDSETEEKIDITDNEANDNLESKGSNSSIVKYKCLLKSIEEEEEAKRNKEVELEFTWGLGDKEKVEKLVKEKMKKNEELTPFEQYLEKRKSKRKAKREERNKHKEANEERDSADSLPSDIDINDKYFTEEFKNNKLLSQANKKRDNQDNDIDSSNEQEEDQRKAELELLLMDKDGDDGRKHFNMKEIEENATLSKSKRKRLSKKKDAQNKIKEDDFEVNVKDPRFAALYTSHNFNIDPADPRYRKTKGTEALINEKLKRRIDNDAETKEDKPLKKSKSDRILSTELQALVKSVKRKTQNITQPIK